MRASAKNSAASWAIEFSRVFVRYTFAMLLMFGIAVTFMWRGATSLDIDVLEFFSVCYPKHDDVIFFVACAGSFTGMFLGCLCLSRCSRFVGGAVLLSVGLGSYYAFYYGFSSRLFPGAKHGHVCFLLPLALGGLGAWLTAVLISRRPKASGRFR
jgi:hypothetical protein